MLTVLEYEEKTTKEETPLNLAVLESGKRLPEAGTNSTVVTIDLGVDKVDLLHDVQIISVKVSHPAKVLDSLVALAL
jgi:hypothetical protein